MNPSPNALAPFDELLERLRQMTESPVPIDADAPVGELGIDSLELLEWFYSIAEDLEVEDVLELDEQTTEPFFSLSLRDLYGRIAATFQPPR